MARKTTSLLALVLVAVAAFAYTSDSLALRSIGAWGVDFADRDPAARPGDDFYRTQNGKWLDTATIDPMKFANSYWLDLRLLNIQRVGALLDQAANDVTGDPRTVEGKLGRFYKSFIDAENLDKLGLKPIQPILNEIRNAKSRSDIVRIMARFDGPWRQRSINAVTPPTGSSMFSVGIGQDQADPSKNMVFLGQAGMFLPAIDYYIDPKLADVKANYVKYIADVLRLIEWDSPNQFAQSVVDFETEVAQSSWTPQQLRDPVASYNPMSIGELKQLVPDFDWDAYLDGAELKGIKRVAIDAKSAYPKLAKLFTEAPLDVLKARAAFSVMHVNGWYLNSELYKAYSEFWVKVVSGGGNARREGRGVNLVTANIGTLLDSYYLKKYFPADYRRVADDMMSNLRAALMTRIEHNSWMSQESISKAREKLIKMTMRVGGPEKSETFQGVEFDPKDLIGNLHKATSFIWRRDLKNLERPFDRNRWQFGSATVNYNYLVSENAIEVPAGLFQAPFFDPKADPAVNYGAVGTLIGNMMLQGFGDTGRHFDAQGRLHDWLTPEDGAKFDALSKKLEDQYSAVETFPGFHIKGELLIDESLADQGGILVALDAYRRSLHGQTAPELDGFTGDQRFFIGRAQMWRAKFRDTFIKNQTATAQNAPPWVRINIAYRNIDAWYEAFGVKPGDKMYLAPEDRVHIW